MNRYRTGAVVTLAVSLASCSGSGLGSQPALSSSPATLVHKQDTQGGLPRLGLSASISIALGDAAPRLGNIVPTKINLAIKEVDAVQKDGTIFVVGQYSTPIITNVLAYQDTPSPISLGQTGIGAYDHLRFVIDTTQSVVIAGTTTYPIQFEANAPSQSSYNAGANSTTTQIDATTVAMTAPGNFMVNGIAANSVDADFNAFESLNLDANGNVIARPTLFAAPNAISGKISGQVVNKWGGFVSNATVVLTDALGNVANTSNTDANGNFLVHTIPQGTYTAYVLNKYTTASGQTIFASGQSPNSGMGWNLGTVTITGGQNTKLGYVQD